MDVGQLLLLYNKIKTECLIIVQSNVVFFVNCKFDLKHCYYLFTQLLLIYFNNPKKSLRVPTSVIALSAISCTCIKR